MAVLCRDEAVLGQAARSGRLGPLAEREFRLLFAGRAISFLGNAMAPIALAFAVIDLTGSKSDLGLVLAARAVPQLVFLLIGGVWADRLPRNKVMVASSLASGATQAAVAVLLLTGNAELWQLLLFGGGHATGLVGKRHLLALRQRIRCRHENPCQKTRYPKLEGKAARAHGGNHTG